MKRLFLPLLVVFCFATNSFAQSKVETVQRIETVKYQESSARNLEPEHLMLLTPLVADLEVSPTKVSHTETEAFKNIIVTHKAIENISGMKKVALSRAARAYNADVMVGTTIDITTNANGCFEITVTGYPAVYKNFRNATKEDLDIIEGGNSIPISNNNNRVILSPDSNLQIVEKNVKQK